MSRHPRSSSAILSRVHGGYTEYELKFAFAEGSRPEDAVISHIREYLASLWIAQNDPDSVVGGQGAPHGRERMVNSSAARCLVVLIVVGTPHTSFIETTGAMSPPSLSTSMRLDIHGDSVNVCLATHLSILRVRLPVHLLLSPVSEADPWAEVKRLRKGKGLFDEDVATA
ncbi:hypothetical protein BDN71DRAFT_1498785 [Pleurotus eryngii]|uniref:Uncharacterized protein n=1 Tax=Pleurotus eryngii TaxID=5323 RepID=A0A9P5ZLJ6_PLEER|nr:hypothetical protein BDN71DRAFT_1498785 [Pleurotus eryngii]